jgi:hypothetical protein
MENPTSQKANNLIDLGDARIQKLIGQANSPSGYEREAALRELKRIGSPQLLPTLICRMNDWVGPVSVLASDALISLLKNENQAYFIEMLPEILHLEKCERRDHRPMISAVISYLLEMSQQDSLVSAITHKNQRISWIAFRLCKEHRLLPLKKLLLLAINSTNINVIRSAADFIDKLEAAELLALAPLLISHKCNAIASRSIKQLNLIAPSEIAKISTDLLFSPDDKVRVIAKDHINAQGGDALTIYRRSLRDANMPLYKRRIALIAIHETCGAESVPDLSEATTHVEPSIRAVAISRLVPMIGDSGRSVALNGIRDESPSTARAAALAFVKQGYQLSVEELLQLEHSSKATNRFEIVMFLAKKGNKWNHILLLLKLLIKKPDQAVAIQQATGQWITNFNLRQTQPTKDQVKVITDLHSRCENILNKQHWDCLKFIVNTLDF